MKILILNWRDIKNPAGGGAEILTHEMAKRWVRWGHEVIQLSSRFRGSLKEEVADGIKIIRMGRWWSVHILAFFYYFFNLRGTVDVIIDEVHWFPFFAAAYAKDKTILLICEVANKLFFKFFPYPLAVIGRSIEKLYLSFYRNIPVIAISPSTKRDLIAEGFGDKDISILPMGINLPEILPKFGKEKDPTIIFVGRILKTKGVENAIKVCLELKKEFRNIKLWILGRGEKNYEREIKKQINDLRLNGQVKFLGFVSEAKKFELMQRAHVLIAPSVKEGFGLTVPEAGIVGTPAIAYDVEGFRDVVKNGKNGVLVDCNPEAMAKKVKETLSNKRFYEKLQAEAVIFAKKLSWDQTAKTGLSVLERLTDSMKQ